MCVFDETGRTMLGGRSLWPLLPRPISFNQAARQLLCFSHDPLCIRPHMYSITVHYLEASPDQAARGKGKEYRGEKKNPISIKILPLSHFPEVISRLPKLYWEK